MNRKTATVERRELPSYTAGEVSMPEAILGMGEQIEVDTAWSGHSHPTHELSWNQRGVSTVSVGERTWTITPTMGLWMPAGIEHTGFAPRGTSYRTAHFDVRAVPAISSSPVSVELTPLLGHLLDRLDDEEITPTSRKLTEQLVVDVIRPSTQAIHLQMPAGGPLRPIAERIVAHAGHGWQLSALASEAGVSEKTLARIFVAETGVGFSTWLTTVRAQRAAILLGTGMRVDDVAEDVGYRSASAFGAAFRRLTGVSPRRFLGD